MLLNDDFGRWTVVGDGWQNVEDEEGNFGHKQPIDIHTTFVVPKAKWYPSLREAIEAFISGELHDE